MFGPQHLVEYEVMRRLQAHPRIKIASLVVRRITSGICLQGVVEPDSDRFDLGQLLGDIDGIETVVDHLVPCQPAAKG
jgi:hypothetical protein